MRKRKYEYFVLFNTKGSNLLLVWRLHNKTSSWGIKPKKVFIVPIISRDGDYKGSISEGDILYAIKDMPNFDIKVAEKSKICKIKRLRSYQAININADINDLILLSLDQNFVPVVDDRNKFIGIVTRKDIIKSFLKNKEE